MDFNDTTEEAAFRAQVRAWLAENAVRHAVTDLRALPLDEVARRGRNWQRCKAAAGYGAIALPAEVGGRDASPMMEVIFAEEEARHAVPVGPFVTIGTQLVVPTLLAHGTPEQRQRSVRPTIEGDLTWCQLFSEPAAGSDLAGIRTRAVRDGDTWIVTGQKVWNSWAQFADWGILLARTDPEVPKHKGITYFVVDMRSPGIEVRPIQQISGDSEFNEVFLTEVRIPDSGRIGPVGAGWKVAMTTLMSERISIGGESNELPGAGELIALAGTRPEDAAGYRLRIAQLVAKEQGLKYFRARLLTQLSRGETPGAVAALAKLVYANVLQDLSALALDIEGLSALYPNGNSQAIEKLHHAYCWAAALRIAGGTDEVLRNQLAERVLGLPGDLRVDKDVPFSKLSARAGSAGEAG